MALFSDNIKISDFQISSTEPRYSNRSWTGSQIQRSTNIQYYTVQFTLNFNKKDLAEYQAFIAKYSQGAAFSIGLGFLGNYTGKQTTAVNATAVAAKGTYQINTNQNSLEVGTLITFSNHPKVYRVIANTGDQISIFPPLRAQVNIGENIRFQGIEGSFVLDTDNEYQTNVKNLMSVTLKATEDI